MGQLLKRQRWQHILVIIISLGGASLFGYLLYDDLYLSHHTFSGHAPAGTLSDKTQTVRRKFSDTMVFDSLASKDTLYWNDSIQTAERSAATIQLEDGNRINLGPSSLVVIEKDNDGLSLNLKNGRVVVEAKGGAIKPARLKVNGTTIASNDGAQVALQMDAEKGQLTAVTKGNDGTAKQITVDRQGHLEEKVIPAELISPAPLSRKYSLLEGEKAESENEGAAVKFKWATKKTPSASDATPDVTTDTLQIAKTGDFKILVEKKDTTAHDAEVRLQPGSYFWRVKLRGSDQKDVFSETRTLDVLSKSAPVLKAPANKEIFSYRNGFPEVDFTWTSRSQATKYLFEVAKDADFKNIIFKEETLNTSYRTSKLSEGPLYWRVTAVFGDETLTATSQLVLNKQTDISPPKLILPEDKFKVTYEYFEKASGINFKWAAQPNETYHFVMAKKANLKDPLISFDTTQSETLIKETLPPGNYYWAVGIKDADGQWKYEEPRPIELGPLVATLAPPPAVGPAENSDLDLLSNPLITWSWKAVAGAKEYHFRLLKVDPKNQQVILEDNLKGLEKEKKDLPDGSYKWLVSSVDNFGRESAPATHEFAVHHGKTLDAPSFDMSEVQ